MLRLPTQMHNNYNTLAVDVHAHCVTIIMYMYSVQNKVFIMLGHLAAQVKFCSDKLGFCSDMKIESSVPFLPKLLQHFHGHICCNHSTFFSWLRRTCQLVCTG